MPTVRLTLAHFGETYEEAVADIESRYAVTVTLVNAEGPNRWPEVDVAAEDVGRLVEAVRGSFGVEDDELGQLGLLSEG